MSRAVDFSQDIINKGHKTDQSSEHYVEAISRVLWPWGDSLLIALIVLLALLDYISTYVALEISGNEYLYEGGLLASWALRTGGFAGLLLFDLAAISALILVALAIRYLHSKFGFEAFGRAASVVMLVPYVLITVFAILNNFTLTFL
ncbi:hypothetical protein ACFLXJ_03310 [Chloroflexota bacterium]